MTDIHAVLLIPAEGDPHGMLREGPCGARPPIACWDGERWRSWTDNGCWWPVVPGRRALVFAWGGKPVAEGMDRATYAATSIPRWWVDHPALADRRWHTHEIVEWVGPTLADLCGCTLVLLDAEGREVSDG